MPEPTTRSRWMMYAASAVVLIFVVTLGLLYVRAERLRSDLAVARAEATLGASALEAQRGSYEVARQLASDFFTQLQETANEAPAAVRPQLATILGQRDAVITMLSRNDMQSADVLARMFTQYRTAIHGPEQAPTAPLSPTPGGAPSAGSPTAPPAAPAESIP